MRIASYFPLGLLFLVVIIHFFANAFGVYDAQIASGFVWIDNVLHAIVGAAFATFWINYKQNNAHSATIFSIIFFVISAAIAWEFLEALFFFTFPIHAMEFKIYSPSLGEALIDIASNILGSILVIAWIHLDKMR